MRGILLSCALVLVMLLSPSPAMAQSPPWCGFVLGFAALRQLIGSGVVGVCLEDQQTNVDNGDAYQKTTGGLLVWRKADNWTAFTDGHRTWINGPHGLQERLNSQRFPWETGLATAGSASVLDTLAASTSPAPSILPVPSTPAAPVASIAPVVPSAPETSVAFISVTGGRVNNYARAAVQTSPHASCTIRYVTPAGNGSVASGLVPKTADAGGRVTWEWLIGTRTRGGIGTVTVTCNGVSASAPILIGYGSLPTPIAVSG
jgi:hypothetical protein